MRAIKDHALAHLWADKPAIMGVVNVTPDSFSDGGQFFNPERAIEHGLRLLEEGADILDIGGESTRPGAQSVDLEEEIDRVVPVIEGLAKSARYISIDTRHAATMRAALKAGANIIN
ncbi:MAG TPA: dihydropteroate synthase, partial [Rhodospirillaceae bacterium]|nr:dihydropteroate synthase [Rhodospirillaceae bacterium]